MGDFGYQLVSAPVVMSHGMFFSLFLQVYLLRIGVNKSIALQAGVFAAITQIFAIPFFGYLGDRWGNRTVLEIGAGKWNHLAFFFFPLVDSKDPLLIIMACIVGMFIQAALWAPLASFIPQLFPTPIRYTGAGLGFQLAGIFGGAFAPLIAVALLDKYNSNLPISLYVAISLIFVALWLHLFLVKHKIKRIIISQTLIATPNLP